VGGAGLRPTLAVFRTAADAAWPCRSSRASTARCAAPQAGLNRSDLGRHYNDTISRGSLLTVVLAHPPRREVHPDHSPQW